jgi:alpha-L-rhamnosidase
MLLERECPSWLYPVTMGATTIWERWDSMLADGTINPGQMTSFNHYAFGAVADWMHKVIGGINPLEPGYSRVLISPRPGGGLTWASTSLDTPHGTVAVTWRTEEDRVTVDVTLPEGVTGVFRSPDGTEKELAASSQLTLQIGA